MSCGNRFQCGITRFQKHSFTPDKPSNPELHNENQKRLSEMLKAREDMDKGNYSSSASSIQTMVPFVAPTASKELAEEPPQAQYTPWKTPSAHDYDKKSK